MTIVKGKGRIWPEYWIDCSGCEHHQPLATEKKPADAARKQGWRRVGITNKPGPMPWLCPACIEDAKEIQQINAARSR